MISYHRRTNGSIEWGEEVLPEERGPWATIAVDDFIRSEVNINKAFFGGEVPEDLLYELIDVVPATGRSLLRRVWLEGGEDQMWDVLPGGVARRVNPADYGCAIQVAAADHLPLGAVYGSVPDAYPVGNE